ncbi:hypothetical protein [Hungatella sp.]|uniref:hypothetical protein n=1 Tax=Hungatella sp. TaxID=2613924 RepID=UPI003AB23E19
MKRKFLNIMLVLLITVACATPVSAQNIYFTDPVQAINATVEGSQDIVKQPKGNVISTGILEISNPGGGEIGVYMQTLSHIEIDETVFGVYLDRWIESEERWANVANYKFTYNKENSPDEDLTTKAISFNIVGQPVDCYYRLRGVHMVISGGEREMLSSRTDGILITK